MRRFLPAILLVVFTLAAIAPIRSYDLFWHLATGRWIAEHRALPLNDPFAVASDREPWVNGSWLAQLFAYALHSFTGIKGLSIVRGVCAGVLFTLIYMLAARDARREIALALTALAFAGAMPLVDVRPSSLAALFVVMAISAKSPIAHAVLAAIWINVHPSALIAPVIAAFATRRVAVVIASALALLVNPYGLAAIIKPLMLMSYVSSGEIVNAEWLPSSPMTFPLLYVAVLTGVVALAMNHKERWRALLFVLFAYLAIRHVRHQPLFFAAFPLLVAPAIRAFHAKLAYAVAVACIAFAAITTPHRLGLLRNRFPVEAVARLKALGLQGNVYNADQFGGYLIWSFYPQRRTLTDGRNELFATYNAEFAKARGDERAWRALLRKYRVDLAVDEYRPRLEVVNAKTGSVTKMPASLAYWPRKEWALVGYDGVAMLFARRAAFPADVISRAEIRRVVD